VVTVLFADIRGYTTMSEHASPEEIVNLLNRYLTIGTECVFAHGGTVDKFIADAIAACFNAPLPQEDHVQRAVQAARAMRERIVGAADGAGIGCGIGLHTGVAIVGNIGSPQLMSYTVIGDAVNVASRLQSNAGAGEVLISDAVYDHMRGRVEVEPLPEPLQVKGRVAAVPVYRLKGLKPEGQSVNGSVPVAIPQAAA